MVLFYSYFLLLGNGGGVPLYSMLSSQLECTGHAADYDVELHVMSIEVGRERR